MFVQCSLLQHFRALQLINDAEGNLHQQRAQKRMEKNEESVISNNTWRHGEHLKRKRMNYIKEFRHSTTAFGKINVPKVTKSFIRQGTDTFEHKFTATQPLQTLPFEFYTAIAFVPASSIFKILLEHIRRKFSIFLLIHPECRTMFRCDMNCNEIFSLFLWWECRWGVTCFEVRSMNLVLYSAVAWRFRDRYERKSVSTRLKVLIFQQRSMSEGITSDILWISKWETF